MDQEHAPMRIETFSENSAARRLGTWVGLVAGIAVLGIVGFSVYQVRQYLPLLGTTIIIALGLVIAGAVLYGVIWLAKFATRLEWHDVGEFSSVSSQFGRTHVFAPMTANTPKLTQRKNKVVVTPVIPSIIELIDQGVIALGQLMMHMGFEQGKGGLIPVIDRWPGTFAIAGMGRSGKTRRVITIIIQAILGNARVFVCDPHRTKPDGLAKMIAPLAPWLTIGRGHEECMAITRQFVAEMKYRVATENAELTPWVIIYDEFSYTMTSNDISDEDKAVIIECVTDCSTQYAGYAGYAGIIGQIWTQEATGGTAIRRSMHKVFVHTLNAEYAKFFVKGKWANMAEDLEPRQCLYRQAGQVKQIITLDVPDNAIEWVANWLEEKMPALQIETPHVGELPTMPNLRMIPARVETFHETETRAETAVSEMPETMKRFDMNRLETLRRLRAEGIHNQSSIIQQIWNVKPGGTTAYQEALAEYKQLLEIIVRGA